MKDENTDSEQLEEVAEVESVETAEPVEEVVEDTVAEPTVDAEPETEDEVETEPEAEPEEDEELEQLSRDEFAAIADEFGDAVAVQVMREGGDYETALQTAYDILKTENEQLRAQVEQSGGHPAKVVAEKKKKGLFNTGK